METVNLSSKGRITIPKWLRDAHQWKSGTELVIVDTGAGINLEPVQPFPRTTLEEVMGILTYDGPAYTVEEMDEAIAKAIQENWGESSEETP